MNWQEVCDDPILQNLPYKLELNRYGEVVMNAVRMEHSFYVEKILLLLKEFLPEGYCPPELAVFSRTSFGKSRCLVCFSGSRDLRRSDVSWQLRATND